MLVSCSLDRYNGNTRNTHPMSQKQQTLTIPPLPPQDNPGPGQPEAHLVQGADGRTGHQEGPRPHRPAALHAARQLARGRE